MPVKSLRHFKPVKGLPFNRGPYSMYFTTPLGDRFEFSDWQRVFDDYDDGAIKPGYPYTGIYGSAEVVGECAYCRKPMYMNKTIMFCPYCRRQHTFEAPDSEYPAETHGVEMAWNIPLPSETQFDTTQYPQQAPGTSRDDSF